MTRPSIPLTDLDVEVITVTDQGQQFSALLMDCPGCRDHSIRIPYGPESTRTRGLLVWQRVSGSTPADLTLSPSYRHNTGERGCSIHGWVRDGRWVWC